MLFVLILSLLIGSFINVVNYRIPRGKSIAVPRSSCPCCGKILGNFDIIPVLSYFLLKGKCRYCGIDISIRYLIIEILTPLIYIFAYCKLGVTFEFLFYFPLIGILVALSAIDIEWGILPNKIIIFGVITGILLTHPVGIGLRDSMYGFLIGGGFLLIIYIVSKGGIGEGDIKMIAMTGIYLGPWFTIVAIFFSFIFGALFSIGLLIINKNSGLKTKIPFGPFISAGVLAVILWGREIILWYFGRILL